MKTRVSEKEGLTGSEPLIYGSTVWRWKFMGGGTQGNGGKEVKDYFLRKSTL